MSYNRAYAVGDEVKVDQYALNGLPTLGPCTVPALVLAASVAAAVTVYVKPEGYPAQDIYKDRVSP